MLDRGIQMFVQKKQLKTKKVINMFLQSEGITNFSFNTRRNRKANDYIQNNWEKFARFVDHGIKTNLFSGNPRPIRKGYWDQVKEEKRKRKEEFAQYTAGETRFMNFLKRHDDWMRLSKCVSFCAKNDLRMPTQNYDAVSRAGKNLPKIRFLLGLECRKELIEYIRTKK